MATHGAFLVVGRHGIYHFHHGLVDENILRLQKIVFPVGRYCMLTEIDL